MTGAETRASRLLRAPQQGTPSENADQCDELFQNGKTHGNRSRSRFLLLLESVDDSVDRIIEQVSSFLTRGCEIRRSVAMAKVERSPTPSISACHMRCYIAD
jgi:hypothetical protein